MGILLFNLRGRLNTIVLGLWMAAFSLESNSEVVKTETFSLHGDFIQGGLVVGVAPKAKEVTFDGQPLRISTKGEFVFGFGRDDEGGHSLVVVTSSGEIVTKHIDVEKREYRIQKIEGISKKIMSPSDSNLKRIRRENASVAKARKTDHARTDFAQTFVWPLKGEITGVYGSQRVFNGVPKRPHFGVDVAAPVGTLVVSPADGIVTLYNADMFYSGGTLLIDHGHGVSSSFLHLDDSLVKEGQRVKRGEVIAKSGVSGRATGPHLDWRMNWFKVRIDPELIVGKTLLQ